MENFIEENQEYHDVYQYLDEVDQVYITAGSSEKAKNRIIGYCLGKRNLDSFVIPKTHEISLMGSRPIQVSDTLTLHITSFHLSLEQAIFKRIFDVLASIIGLIVLSPILIAIAVTIKLYDGGPVFFRQERLTRANTKFLIYKFRSMIADAEILA